MSLTYKSCQSCANWGTGECNFEDFRDRHYLRDKGQDCFVYSGKKTYNPLVTEPKDTMEDKIIPLDAVFKLDSENGMTELRLLADSVDHRKGWVVALWKGRVVGGVKEEHLKAFYLTHRE